jgi:exopolyphosphatase / guanosine-5'-triphosphate,3'-diphosphate pyrophosphatase
MAYHRGGPGGDPARRQKPPPAQNGAMVSSGRFPQRKSYAALDLGTNNCRMLIARPEGENFAIIDAFSRIVRLGEGLSATGRLSEAAMDRTLSALSICSAKLIRRNVTISHAVATEACRRAANGPDFVDRILRETGIQLNVITAEEEARLAVLGCHRLLEPGDGPALVFDIGGGSTELILVDTNGSNPRTIDWLSIPWGVVSLAESIEQDSPDADERMSNYVNMRDRIARYVDEFIARIVPSDGPLRLLGTSGTVTTLASVHLGLESYDRRQIDGLRVARADMLTICEDLARKSIPERAEFPCIGPERADLVVAGCAILEAIMAAWPAETVGVADRGIREGILRELFRMDHRP